MNDQQFLQRGFFLTTRDSAFIVFVILSGGDPSIISDVLVRFYFFMFPENLCCATVLLFPFG